VSDRALQMRRAMRRERGHLNARAANSA
jgi:hypothetical protein